MFSQTWHQWGAALLGVKSIPKGNISWLVSGWKGSHKSIKGPLSWSSWPERLASVAWLSFHLYTIRKSLNGLATHFASTLLFNRSPVAPARVKSNLCFTTLSLLILWGWAGSLRRVSIQHHCIFSAVSKDVSLNSCWHSGYSHLYKVSVRSSPSEAGLKFLVKFLKFSTLKDARASWKVLFAPRVWGALFCHSRRSNSLHAFPSPDSPPRDPHFLVVKGFATERTEIRISLFSGYCVSFTRQGNNSCLFRILFCTVPSWMAKEKDKSSNKKKTMLCSFDSVLLATSVVYSVW